MGVQLRKFHVPFQSVSEKNNRENFPYLYDSARKLRALRSAKETKLFLFSLCDWRFLLKIFVRPNAKRLIYPQSSPPGDLLRIKVVMLAVLVAVQQPVKCIYRITLNAN